MKSFLLLSISAVIMILVLASCNSQIETKYISKDDIAKMFANEGYTVQFEEWPPAKSGNFPIHLTPTVIKLGGEEEIWLFEFDDLSKANDELSKNTDKDKRIYYKDLYVMMYNGENQTIINILKNHFTVTDWKR